LVGVKKGASLFKTGPSLIGRMVDRLAKGGLLTSAGVAYMVMAGVVVDVLLRYLVGRPIVGMYEAVTVCCVVLGFYGLPQTMVVKREIRVDIIARRFTGKGGSILEVVYAILGALVFGLLTYSSWKASAWTYQQKMLFGETVELPVCIPWFLIAMVATLCLMQSVRALVVGVHSLFRPPRGQSGRSESTGEDASAPMLKDR